MLSPAPKAYCAKHVHTKPHKQAFLYYPNALELLPPDQPTPKTNAQLSIESYSFYFKKNHLVILRAFHIRQRQEHSPEVLIKLLFSPAIEIAAVTAMLKRYAPYALSKAFSPKAILSQEKNALHLSPHNHPHPRRKVKRLFNVLLKQAQKQNKTLL